MYKDRSLKFGGKKNKLLYRGEPPTHWTTESMQHCTCIGGVFSTDLIQEAMNSFKDTFHDSDGYDQDYIDGERFLEGPFTIDLYGLVLDGTDFYWTGDIKKVKFQLNISVE